MSKNPGRAYLGKVTGKTKKGINVHTGKANEVMLPKPKALGDGVISLKIKLD